MSSKSPQIFCLKCKSQTATINAKKVKSANGRMRMTGNCLVCSTKKSKFISSAYGGMILNQGMPKVGLNNKKIDNFGEHQ